METVDDLLLLTRMADALSRDPTALVEALGADAGRAASELVGLGQRVECAETIDELGDGCARTLDALGAGVVARLREWSSARGPQRKPIMPGRSPRIEDSPRVKFLCNRLVELTQEIARGSEPDANPQSSGDAEATSD